MPNVTTQEVQAVKNSLETLSMEDSFLYRAVLDLIDFNQQIQTLTSDLNTLTTQFQNANDQIADLQALDATKINATNQQVISFVTSVKNDVETLRTQHQNETQALADRIQAALDDATS